MRAHLSTDSSDTAHANGVAPASDPADTTGPATGTGGAPTVDEAGIARLFEMTSDLLAAISLDGRFTLLNPAWEGLLGWSRAELLSRPIEEFMHPEDVQQTLALMRAGGNGPS